MGTMQQLLDKFAEDEEINGLKTSRLPFTVLIVDDQASTRAQLRYVFTSVGYRVLEADCVSAAIDKFMKDPPDVITMDLIMPGGNGIEGLQEILARDSTAKVVVLSSEGYKEVVLEAIENGAKNFFVKPIKEKNLKQILKSIKTVASSS